MLLHLCDLLSTARQLNYSPLWLGCAWPFRSTACTLDEGTPTCTACETGYQGTDCSECASDSVCMAGSYCNDGTCTACTTIGSRW